MVPLTFVLASAVLALAQPATTVGPRQSSTSDLLVLRAGDTVVVRPVSVDNQGVSLGIEVYDEAGTLAGRDDEEVAAEQFEWTAPRDGRFSVRVRNLGDVAAAYALTVMRPTARTAALPPEATNAVVKVFYATNRTERRAAGGTVAFDAEPRAAGDLAYGVARVSVPRDHRMGALEGPSILRLEFRADPDRHIVLLGVESRAEHRFFDEVGSAAGRSRGREAFVFVHGFATTFEDATRRTAQMAYDLGFEGAPIAFSWPSAGSVALTGYTRDGRNAELSAGALKTFLERLAKSGGVTTIHVVAHSMGNRVLTNALDLLVRSSVPIPQLNQVALMAPDIDAESFRQLADRIKRVPARLTLYASSGDEALRASQQLAGYPRAGQGGPAIVIVPGIDTVDASQVDTSLLGLKHSYYADNRTIVSDLFYLFRGNAPEERAALAKRTHRNGVYWEFRPAAR